MKPQAHVQPPIWPFLAWSSLVLAGIVAPALAILLLVRDPATAPSPLVGGPMLAISLMAVAMITGAATGRLWISVLLALLTGLGLISFALALGMPPVSHAASAGLALAIAGISFAARGALFARSASDKGWLVAVFVVAGEAAIVATATTAPGMLPEWLLALLPAQWASVSIQSAISGPGTMAAIAPLFALAGTAAATLLVVHLWPKRWPYLIMFTAWLGFSAVVYYSPLLPPKQVERGMDI